MPEEIDPMNLDTERQGRKMSSRTTVSPKTRVFPVVGKKGRLRLPEKAAMELVKEGFITNRSGETVSLLENGKVKIGKKGDAASGLVTDILKDLSDSGIDTTDTPHSVRRGK